MASTSGIGHIETPSAEGPAIASLPDFLAASDAWYRKYSVKDHGMLSDLWYRGVNRHFDSQVPGVYRPNFTARAAALEGTKALEEKRLELERNMLSQFRGAGAQFLENRSLPQLYFLAQHFGMPTRLLDWSTNPLAALYFACVGEPKADGFIYAMDAKQIIPPNALRANVPPRREKLFQRVMTMRHDFVEYAIGISFWEPINQDYNPFVLPIRPDTVPGRIGQQNSCFTLHMHGAQPASNPTMITMRVDAARKPAILEELHRVNINQFTIFHDLDHLSREIRKGWNA